MQPKMCGGFSEAQQVPQDVQDALRAQLASNHNINVQTIVSAQKQVVAGINYKILVLDTTNVKYMVTLWAKLDKTFVVTNVDKQ